MGLPKALTNFIYLPLVALIVIASSLNLAPRAPAEASIASITDVADLSTYKKHRAYLKAATGPANNAEINLVNITSGSGVVNYIWLADRPGSGGGYPQFDHAIRIYTNGNSTPDIDTDLGLFFGYAYGDVMPANNIHTRHWHARVGGPTNPDRASGGFKLPIPFTDGIRIAVANTNNTPVSAIFSQVDYALTSENSGMTIPPYTLKAVGNKWQGNRQTASSGNDHTIATIPSGNAGVVVGHSMAGGGASNYSYLERYIALYVDGETNPSIQSSGTEDWFTASDYFFTGQTPFSSDAGMGFGVTSDTAYGFSALVDLLALNGGFAFDSSATLKWLNHSAVTSSNTYGNLLFFYRHI